MLLRSVPTKQGAVPTAPRWGRLGAAAGASVFIVVAAGVVLADGSAAGAATVTVQRGQTLSGIAAQLRTSVAALAAANHLSDPDRVLAGQVLQVPAPGGVTPSGAAPSGAAPGGAAPSGAAPGSIPPGSVTVVVARGDTLSAIASRYRTTVAAIAQGNGITDVNRVFAGMKLRIPLAAASGMQLASYDLPAGSSPYPAQLLAHPNRMALQPDFTNAATTYGVPLPLLEALCWWESGWQTTVVSGTGALGVCQVEPATADLVNRTLVHASLDPHVASQNIALGAAYLASLLRATGGHADQALAGYYQGLTSVRRKGMLPSTTHYVQGIEAYARIFAG